MAGRWREASAFRADPSAAPATHPSHRQTLALLAVLALVGAAVALASSLVRPERARSFDLVHGSLFLGYEQTPVAVDLANGTPTLRLLGADAQVGGLTTSQNLGVVPLDDGTLLLNESSGEFNMVDNTGFVVKHSGGGVPLVTHSGSRSSNSFGVASDDGEAYVVRTGATGGAGVYTDVYLVNQATVESAASASKSVRPRASTSMSQATTSDPGGAVGADGDLWLLAGNSTVGTRTVRQLSVPAGSSAGAALTTSDRGTVTGPAALGTATQRTDGSGTTVVGVATRNSIRVYTGGGTPRTEPFRAPAGVDSILPATGGQGRLAFLLHGSAGWSVVSVGTDGSGLRPPKLVPRLPTTARLAAPATGGGTLYTIDKSNGHTYRLNDDGQSEKVPPYPLAAVKGKPAESSDFSDAYVIARDGRIVYNSPTHLNALMIFPDDSSSLTIAKNAAVLVDASTGAEALTASAGSASPAPGNPSGGSKPRTVQPVNPKLDCNTAKQKPHVPLLTTVAPGSRSVTLVWSYPLLDSQDCVPSTYLVTVTLLSNDAPPAPESVRVPSQTGATITGLFPSTRYNVTVAAYIHGESTASAPRQIETGEEGPAAPTGLRVHADASGNWTVDWNSCGSVEQGCVPAQSWTVTPSYCDGRGVGNPPTPLTETADPTSRVQPTATYKSTSDLLGRGLRFQVQGTGEQGQAGTPSATSGCVYSWMPPDAAAMTLQASTAPVQQLGQSTTATVHLDLGDDPTRATGGVGAKITYKLLSGGQVVQTVGPTTQTDAHFDGIVAGQHYQAQATVSAPKHGTVTATVGPIDVETAHAPWPAISVTVDQPQNQGALQATIAVHIGGLTSTAAGGETFDLTNDSGVYCANTNETGGWTRAAGIDPADPLTFTVDRSQLFGTDCTVKVQLVQNPDTGTAVFGAGTASNLATSASFAIDAPELLGVGSDDFAASWDGTAGTQSQIAIVYVGGNPLVRALATNWTVAVTDPKGDSCGGYENSHTLADVVVTQSCVDKAGDDGSDWHLAVSFTFIGAAHGPFTVQGPKGAAPTHQSTQCDPSQAALTATWAGTKASPQVAVAAGTASALAGCSGFEYTVVGPQTASCGSDTSHNAPPVSVDVTCQDPPATTGWQVTIGYQDAGKSQHSYTIPAVTGTPPA